MIPVIRRTCVTALLVALAGCAQAPQLTFQLPWGGGYTSWGYTSASRTIEGLTGVVYMPNKGYREAARVYSTRPSSNCGYDAVGAERNCTLMRRSA